MVASPERQPHRQQQQHQPKGSTVAAGVFNFSNSIIGAGCIGLGGAMAQSGGACSVLLLVCFGFLTKRSLDLVIELSVRVAREKRQIRDIRTRDGGDDDDDDDDVMDSTSGDGDATFHTCEVAIDSADDPSGSSCSQVNSHDELCGSSSDRLAETVRMANLSDQHDETETDNDNENEVGLDGGETSAEDHPKCSYEELAEHVLGAPGRVTVSTSKFLYSLGCLIAYVVVIKDNFGTSIRELLARCISFGNDGNMWWYDDILITWLSSASILLPLCLLRDPTPLAKFSVFSVVAMGSIVVLVIYVFVTAPELRRGSPHGSFQDEWLTVRPGIFESLGTFVFTFVSQHTAHLVFDSLRPNLRTVKNWKTISFTSILCALFVSLTISVLVYATFGTNTTSDIFQLYPEFVTMDAAKLLLSITMLLTFPLPFFTCREILVVSIFYTKNRNDNVDDEEIPEGNDLREPLLSREDEDEENQESDGRRDSGLSPSSLSRFLCPENDKQLRLPFHALLTVSLWWLVTALAIAAPNLGDILDLVGCASGTIIAFLVPSLLSLRMDGFSLSSATILAVGGVVGGIGTYYSLKQLIEDI